VSIRSELRAEALERDRGCRWPSDWHDGSLEMCHIHQLSQGGLDVLENVVMLCRFHHGVLDNRVAKGLSQRP
jgi:5-methylcytosine-specific restriction endonuclease McrA